MRTIRITMLLSSLLWCGQAAATGMHIPHIPDITAQGSQGDSSVVDPMDGILGTGPLVTVFLDRGVKASRNEMPVLAALAASGVQVDIKELPLTSETSVIAARCAVAARQQGDEAFRAYEMAMMLQPGEPTAPVQDKVVQRLQLDAKQFAADRDSQETSAYLSRTRALANDIGVHGTPFFLVGRHVLVGTQSLLALQNAVKAP